MNPASIRELTKYEADVEKLHGRARVWIVFSHVAKNFGIDEEKFYLYHLERSGKRLDAFEQTEAAAHLFDLRGLVKENSPAEAVGLQSSAIN